MRVFSISAFVFLISSHAIAESSKTLISNWNGTIELKASENCADENCDLSAVKIGRVSLKASAKDETPPQIYSKAYVALEKFEELLKNPSLSCSDRIREMNALVNDLVVEHVDDLVILDYIKNNMETYLSKPELRSQLASALIRRPVSGTVFCQPSNKNCDFRSGPGMLASNSLIKIEIDEMKSMGHPTVNGFRKLDPANQAKFISNVSARFGDMLKNQDKMKLESEAFARDCDRKVSRVFGKGNVYCTVTGYGIHPVAGKKPDGKYYLGGYDSAWDGRWHCYPDDQGTYDENAELQMPKGGEGDRTSLGCYTGQRFYVSVAHERRVKGKILFGGHGGGTKKESGSTYGLHTHLELVLKPMQPRLPGQSKDEWWQSQKKIDPVNVFCRGDCYP